MREYFPSKIIDIEAIRKSDENFALIILNRPIVLERQLVETLWTSSALNVTVDGGINRWLTFLRTHKLEEKLEHPALLTGDFDSCHSASRAFFAHTKVVPTPDQDETDFTKCLRVLEPLVGDLKIARFVVVCESSGRLDQILANVNTLHKNRLQPADIFVLSSTSVSWLLPAGHHRIHIPESVRHRWCALVPVGEPCAETTTRGLKWNLNGHRMEFGGVVSTSNCYDGSSEAVEVKCSAPLLWSMGIGDED